MPTTEQLEDQGGGTTAKVADVNPSFQEAFNICYKALEGLSNKDATNVLKALGGIHNLKVASAFAPTGPTQTPPVSRDTRGQVRLRTQPKASPEVKVLRSKIKNLNQEISLKSRGIKGPLPVDDPLIEARNVCFRDLKEAQNKQSATVSDGTQARA
jgi:hypothetical protein